MTAHGHGHPVAFEMLRLTAFLTVAALSITVVLPFLLALAASAGR